MTHNSKIKSLKNSIESIDYDLSNIESYIEEIEDEIRDLENDCILKVENLNDEFKAKLVKELYDKLTLEEIQHLLKWEQGKGTKIK